MWARSVQLLKAEPALFQPFFKAIIEGDNSKWWVGWLVHNLDAKVLQSKLDHLKKQPQVDTKYLQTNKGNNWAPFSRISYKVFEKIVSYYVDEMKNGKTHPKTFTLDVDTFNAPFDFKGLI